MKKNFISVVIALASVFFAAGIFAAEESIDLAAQTTVNEPYCKGVVYSFPLPAEEVYFKGLSGYVSMTPTEPIFTQSLVWVANVPGGNCPINGSELNEATLPAHTWLASYILKNSDNKKVNLETNFQLPVKIPIKGCVIVIVGGCGIRATPLTSESHMTLLYDTTPPDNIGKLVALSYELGYGGGVGASGGTDCTEKNCAFASVWRADGDYTLQSMYGNVSASGLNGLVLNPPTGNWSTDFNYFLYNKCDGMKDGINGPADFYSRIPADAVALHQINQNVDNQWLGQTSADKVSLFGGITDKPIGGDWNGDGKTEIGNYKGNGVWALDYNGNGVWDGTGADKLFTFKNSDYSDYQPTVGDWNNDNKDEIGGYEIGLWLLDLNGNGVMELAREQGTASFVTLANKQFSSPIEIKPGNCLVALNRVESPTGGSINTESQVFFSLSMKSKKAAFGGAGDLPVTGDWNGDGKTEIGNYKGNGVWALDYNGNGVWDGAGTDKLFTFGSSADQPVTGDWNGDGKTEIGNYKGNGVWALDYNGNGVWDGTGADKIINFGIAGDLPVTGDWNGDGKDKPGLYRSLNFYLFGVDKAEICAAGSVSGCKVCKADGSDWIDDNTKCAADQYCDSGICKLRRLCTSKTCAALGNYQCGSWSDGCGKTLNCGICASGKTCRDGQCVSSGGGDGGGVIDPQKEQPQKMTRAEILAKITEIKQLLIKLIIQLIAELQKQLLAIPK